uniref:CCHC-type domain-containing protein n=1 Tax=Amphimedon queenslandica TaxID=400682 RepID=A0A1X7SKF6_AMPQE
MEARVAALTKSIEDTNKQNAALFERISSRFDEVAELASKKTKIDRSVLELRSKGNEDRFVFAEKIKEQLRESSKQLPRTSTLVAEAVSVSPEALTQSIAKTKKSLDKGMKQVTHCQKLIKMADRSEIGWKVVKEYESDSLAENEEDEKRIAKAEKAAASAATKKKSVSKPIALAPTVRTPQQHFRSSLPIRGSFSLGPSTSRSFGSAGGSRPIGFCFRCSEMGHLQSSCPKLSSPQYPSHSCNYTEHEIDGCG